MTRNIAREVHLWFGLLTGVAAIVMAVTGLLITHGARLGLGAEGPPAQRGTGSLADVAEINDLLKAALREAVARDVRIVNRFGGSRPSSGPSAIGRAVFRPATGTVQVRLRDPKPTELVLDWSTGAVLSGAPRHDVRLRHVHAATALGQRGVIISDLVAVALSLLVITGILLWLVRVRDRGGAVSPTSGWWMFNWWLHRVGGLAAAIYLVILAGTGILLNHKHELGLMVEPVRELDAELVARSTPSRLPAIIHAAVEALTPQYPGTTSTDVAFVDYRPLRGYAKVRFKQDEMEVIVEAYEGRILSIAPRRDKWIEDLHSGLLFGAYGPLLSDVTSLLLIVLTVNGLYLWVWPSWIGRGRPVPVETL